MQRDLNLEKMLCTWPRWTATRGGPVRGGTTSPAPCCSTTIGGRSAVRLRWLAAVHHPTLTSATMSPAAKDDATMSDVNEAANAASAARLARSVALGNHRRANGVARATWTSSFG